MQEEQKPPTEQVDNAAFIYKDSLEKSSTNAKNTDEITWTASEFIAHSKSVGWYFVLGLTTAVIVVPLFVFVDKFSAVIIAISALLFGIVAAKKPRELPYKLSSTGITVDQKFYSYSNFKSFSVLQEEGIESIWFSPLRRFQPGLSIYFAPEDGDKIADYLEDNLPFEDRELALVDKIMHRIRF